MDAINQAAWVFDPITREVIVGATPCFCTVSRDGEFAGRTFGFPWVACDKCKGTGKRGNGKCRACAYWRDAYNRTPGYTVGMVPDYATPLDMGVCGQCDGTTLVVGDGNAWPSAEFMADVLSQVTFEVTATGARHTWVESHIGLSRVDTDTVVGKAYTVIGDYGRRWGELVKAREETDAVFTAVIESIREEARDHVTNDRKSICNWAVSRGRGETWLMPHRIIAMVSPDGMRIMAIYDRPSTVEATAA